METDDLKTIDAEIDRVYVNPSSSIVLYTAEEEEEAGEVGAAAAPAATSAPKEFLTIEKKAFLSAAGAASGTNDTDIACDVVLWNAWIAKSLTLPDLDDEAYLEYVCVEPGTVNGYVTVKPGSSLTLQQNLLPAVE